MKRIVAIIALIVLAQGVRAQFPLDTFMDGIEKGVPIETNRYTDNPKFNPLQWNMTMRTYQAEGSSPVAVAPLKYKGYAESGKSNAIKLEKLAKRTRLSCYSLYSKRIPENSTGTFYLAFMINVGEVATSEGVHIIAYDGSYDANFQRVSLYVRKLREPNTFSFGIGYSGDIKKAEAVFSNEIFDTGTTCLIVLKYDCDTDEYALFVNPKTKGGEPKATLRAEGPYPDRTLAQAGVRAITLKQSFDFSAVIGGLRLAKSWEEAVWDEKTWAKQK